MNFKLYAVCICVSLTSIAGSSQEVEELKEVVISNSLFEFDRADAGKVITLISQEQLKKLQGQSIAEIINSSSGIEINGVKSNGGQNLTSFIRGGRNRQVLVLIDGIAFADASQIANNYDLRLLDANQVESIEILKGASSTLYGSGAAAAVINIKLKKASKNKISAHIKSSIGSFQDQKNSSYNIENFMNNVSINGTLDDFSYLTSFGNQFSNGLSAIESGTEKDVFNLINGNLKLGYSFSDSLKFNIYGNIDRYKADFDDGFGYRDAENILKVDQYRFGFSSTLDYQKGSVQVNGGYNDLKRDISSDFPSLFYSNRYIIDAFNKYIFNNKFYTVLGISYQKSEMESFTIPFGGDKLENSISKNNVNILDPYANMVFKTDFGLNINTGLRLNNHNEYGSHLVYSLNPSFIKKVGFGYIKGLASYGTAYIVPSLYQLFEPTYGNIDLKPEENASIELGAEVGIKDLATISLVYFNRKETNFIDFIDSGNFLFKYKNTDKTFVADGIELNTDFSITKEIKLHANATYTNVSEDLTLRVPKIKVNAKVNYSLNDRWFMRLSYQYNDKREDSFYNSQTFGNEVVTLNDYSLLDYYLSYSPNNRWSFFMNLSNILNSEYQELYKYSTRGRNVNLGFSLGI